MQTDKNGVKVEQSVSMSSHALERPCERQIVTVQNRATYHYDTSINWKTALDVSIKVHDVHFGFIVLKVAIKCNFPVSEGASYLVPCKKVYPAYNCSCSKEYEMDLDKVLTVVKMFHSLHLEIFIDCDYI